jgi:hypothetical protein
MRRKWKKLMRKEYSKTKSQDERNEKDVDRYHRPSLRFDSSYTYKGYGRRRR